MVTSENGGIGKHREMAPTEYAEWREGYVDRRLRKMRRESTREEPTKGEVVKESGDMEAKRA